MNGLLKAGLPQAIDGFRSIAMDNSDNDNSNFDGDSVDDGDDA